MAKQPIYGFTEQQVARLRRIADIVEGDDTFSPSNVRPRRHLMSHTYVGLLSAELPGTTGLTAKPTGPVDFNIYWFSTTGTIDTEMTIPTYNFSTNTATTDRWAVIEVCSATGYGILTTQYCS